MTSVSTRQKITTFAQLRRALYTQFRAMGTESCVVDQLDAWHTHYYKVHPVSLQTFLSWLNDANIRAVLTAALELIGDSSGMRFYRDWFIDYLAWCDMRAAINLAIEVTDHDDQRVNDLIRNAMICVLGDGLEARDKALAALEHTRMDPDHRRRLQLAVIAVRDTLVCVTMGTWQQIGLEHLLFCAGVRAS
jgi:hypothetical protein